MKRTSNLKYCYGVQYPNDTLSVHSTYLEVPEFLLNRVMEHRTQGWSIVSVHTENVSTTKFSNSRWDPTSKRDTPQGPYVQIENDNIWFDLTLSICVLPKATKTFIHASLFHNMVNIFCPNWQTIVRTNCFGTRVIDRNLALSTVEKEWESLRKYEKLLFSLVRLRKFEII